MNCWLLSGKCLKKQPLDYYGFVYKITVSNSKNIPEEIRGRIYIGKKAFNYRKKIKLSKKKRKQTGKRVAVTSVDSNWLNYFGSNKQLIDDVEKFGKKYFKREILHLCKNKSHLSYYEAKEQINHDVLSCNSYNGWIKITIFKNTFLK